MGGRGFGLFLHQLEPRLLTEDQESCLVLCLLFTKYNVGFSGEGDGVVVLSRLRALFEEVRAWKWGGGEKENMIPSCVWE